MSSTVATNTGAKKYIRLNGILGFIAVVAFIVTLLYVFAEPLVKTAIEKGGEVVLGAEVNVDAVDITYSPLSLTIHHFQATDAQSPRQNIVSFKTASAGIEAWQYLLGKTIIDQLTIEGLEFSSKREQIGEVYRQQNDEQNSTEESSILPSVDLALPDVKTLLNQSDLRTVKAAEQLQLSYDEENAKLSALKQKLPSKAKLKAYQVKLKEISHIKVKSLDDLNRVKTQYEALKKSFKADKAIVKEAKTQLLASKQRLSTQLLQLKAAPGEDWNAIESKYQLDKVDTEDFAHILFGEQARGYYQKAEYFYQLIAPMLSESVNSTEEDKKLHGATGRFVVFHEDDPLPSFLIKNAELSMVMPQGNIAIDAKEITHQHWLRGKPSTIKVTSTNLMSTGILNMDTQFEVAPSGDLSGKGKWLANQVPMENIEVNPSKALDLTLTKGLLSGDGAFSFNQGKKGNSIDSANHFLLSQTNYDGKADSKFASILLDTFKSLDSLSLDVGLKGNITDPDLSLSSSLDNALAGAVKQQIANKLQGFKTEVNAGLNEKLSQYLNTDSDSKQSFVDFESLITDTDSTFKNLENSDIVKQQTKKLEDQAADKIKGKLKGLFGG